MNNTKEYLAALTQFKQKFADKYGIRVIGIFGSVARGEQRPDSDVDVFVDLVRIRSSLQQVLLNNIQKDGLYA